MNDLEKTFAKLLDEAGIKYNRIWQYEGCSDTCGPMPRVIIDFPFFANRICYHIDELKLAINDGKLKKD
jgi:hypothetical protein